MVKHISRLKSPCGLWKTLPNQGKTYSRSPPRLPPVEATLWSTHALEIQVRFLTGAWLIHNRANTQVAQLVERPFHKQDVVGSIPTAPSGDSRSPSRVSANIFDGLVAGISRQPVEHTRKLIR